MKRIMKKLGIIILVVFLSIFEIFSQDSKNYQMLIDSILALKDDTSKVNQLNNLLWKLYNDTNYNHLLAQKSIEISERLGYFYGIATAQKNIAAYYYYTANYDKALELYNHSLQNYEKAQDKKGIGISYRNIGNIYSQIGNWKVAIDYYLKSLRIREEIKDSSGIGAIYNAIGLIYIEIQGYEDSALVYFKRALRIFNKLNDNYNISSTYLNLSTLFYSFYQADKKKTNYLDSCYNYIQKSITKSKVINNTRLLSSGYEIVGQVFIDKQVYDSAFYYLNQSLILRRQANNMFGVANSLNRIGKYYLSINNPKESKKYLLEAKKIAEEQNFPPVLQNVYTSLSDANQRLGNYKEAFEFYVKATKIKDSLQTQDNTKKITQLSMQYEFDKQQRIKELEQQKKDAIKEAIIKRQRLISILALAALVLALITAMVIFRSYRQKQKTNKILEQKNQQILQQNEELNQKNEEISAQRDKIEFQKVILEQKNKSITESINYAQRIQNALLNYNFFKSHFRNYFILFKPRDIVSGDFFWGTKLNNKLIITVADCTGHGVPGAFVSLLGISFLNQIVEQQLRFKEDFRASEILNKLRELVIHTLGTNTTNELNEEENEFLQDGMDIALCIIDYDKRYLNFAGAYNPLYQVRNDELIVINADRMPVGYHFAKMNNFFEDKFIELEIGDKYYMFSDGYADQMGGPDNKKLSQAVFKKIILDNSKFPFAQQKQNLEDFIVQWMGESSKQTDDILIVGFEIDLI